MINGLKNRLKRGWHFMRFIRLGLAALVIVEGFKNAEIIFVLMGLILLFQAVFNYGCCGVSGCDIAADSPGSGSSQPEKKEITFEEVK